MVEFVIISPLLLLIGLGVVQTGQVFHAKSALNFALQEAARMGAVSNGDISKIQQGFIRGLVPYMGGSTGRADFELKQAEVAREFALGAASGWIRMRQLSPSQQSFSDWSENSFDESGNAVREIPNANLAMLRCNPPAGLPAGGTAGVKASTACRGGEPIGASSQQTLADANLLKLELTYGVRMGIPVVNRIVGRALAMAKGCRAPERQRVGVLSLGTPEVAPNNPAECAHYLAVDERGNPAPRMPVNLAITVRMQTPARLAGNQGWFTVMGRTQDANTSGRQLGNGNVDDASEFAPIPVATLNPMGVTLANDSHARLRGDGATFLGYQRDRSSGQPPQCGVNTCCRLAGVGAGPSSRPPWVGQSNQAPPASSVNTRGSSGPTLAANLPAVTERTTGLPIAPPASP